MIHLRSAGCGDARSLAELRVASLLELDLLPSADAAWFHGRAEHEYRELFRADRLLAWIACDAERVVGSSCAVFYDRLPYPEGSRHAEICGVYVRPAYRNRGFASELVREVVRETRVAGVRKAFLRPSCAARSLYARLGFVDADLMSLAWPSEPRLERDRAVERVRWPA